jgi:hypothetical protein
MCWSEDDPNNPGNQTSDCEVDSAANELVCGPNRYPLPDRSDDPDKPPISDDGGSGPGDMPGDDNGDGICQEGEACSGKTSGDEPQDLNLGPTNELLREIRDELQKTLPSTPEEQQEYWDGEMNSAIEKLSNEHPLEGSEAENMLSGMEGELGGIGSTLRGVFFGTGSCPDVSVTLPYGHTFEPDIGKAAAAFTAIMTFLMWGWMAFNIWQTLVYGLARGRS